MIAFFLFVVTNVPASSGRPSIEADTNGNVLLKVGSSLRVECPETISAQNPVACSGSNVQVDQATGQCVPRLALCSGSTVEIDSATGACVGTTTSVTQAYVDSQVAAAQASMSGTIQMWPMSVAPAGWLVCDGSAVSRTTYANLYNAIGQTYGAGDGTTTFNVPDFRGLMPLGASTANEVGDTGGSSTATFTPLGTVSASISGTTQGHVLTVGQMPKHNHCRGSNTDDWGAGGANGYVGGDQNRGGSCNADGRGPYGGYQPPGNGNDESHSHDIGASASVSATFTGASTTVTQTPPYRKVLFIIKS